MIGKLGDYVKCPREGCSWEGEPKDFIRHLQQAHGFKTGEERSHIAEGIVQSPVHPDIKLEAPPVMIEDAQRSGFMEAIGIMILKRAKHWTTKIDEEVQLLRAGAVDADTATYNINSFIWAQGEASAIAEGLGVPQHIIRSIELERNVAQTKAMKR